MTKRKLYGYRTIEVDTISDFDRADLPRRDCESRKQYFDRLKLAGLPLEIKELNEDKL